MATGPKRFTADERRVIDSRKRNRACIMCGKQNSNTLAGDFRCGGCPEGHERVFNRFWFRGERETDDILLAHKAGDCGDGCW